MKGGLDKKTIEGMGRVRERRYTRNPNVKTRQKHFTTTLKTAVTLGKEPDLF